MKHYLNLVSISNKVHRRQSRMTRICIILAVFLVAVMFGLADMYLQSMTAEIKHQTGDWHAKFSVIDEEMSALIAAKPETELSGWQGTLPAEAGVTVDTQSVALVGIEEPIFSKIYFGTFSEGTAPATNSETAISETAAQNLNLSAGDSVSLTLPDGSTYSFTVTGVFNDEAASLTTGNTCTLLITPQALSSLNFGSTSPSWQYVVCFSLLCKIPDTIQDILTQNNLSVGQVLQNDNLLSMLGQLPGSNMSQIYLMAFALSLAVMMTCILMISSSLNSNVSQRTEVFGLMRCLGATRRQVLLFVRQEALHWCVTSIPIGIGLSIIAIWVLCAVMRQLDTVWFGYMPVFGISWLSIAISIVLGIVTVLLAARSPAKFASKVSPLEAVTGSAHQNTPFRHAANTHRWKVDIALGIHHAKAKRSSFLLITCAFAICLTLFLGFCTLVPFMKNAFMPNEWASELSIVSESNTCSIPFEQRDAVSEVSSVSRVFGRMFAYDVPAKISGTSHNSNLISYEENQFRWAGDRLTSGSIDMVANTPRQVLFVANTGTPAQVGDTVTLEINGVPQTVTIGGILTDDPLAREEGTETLICSEETFTQLTGESGYTILDVQFRFGAGEEDVKAVEALFADGVTFTDTLTRAQQQHGLYYAFSVLVYGFLSIIVAITVFHIMNTISMGGSARTRQYGVMRAIGMSNRQLTRMIASEAVTYAATGVILGCFLGLTFHWFLYTSLITRTFGDVWSIPWPELCLIIAVILGTTALSVREPTKRIQAMSIVENISAQ